MKLLLIEDNPHLADRIKHHMRSSFIVTIASDGISGLKKASEGTYGAIVLDLTLPDINGYEICRQLRSQDNPTPIVVISGIGESDNQIKLLDCGADDYLVKPFNPRELIARIHAVIRRHATGYAHHIMKVKDLTIDINRRYVERGGRPILLRRKEFDILECLIANRGNTVTRAMLLNHAWGTTKGVWHTTVDVHIKYLRDKVDKPFDVPLIKTAYGVGYIVEDTA